MRGLALFKDGIGLILMLVWKTIGVLLLAVILCDLFFPATYEKIPLFGNMAENTRTLLVLAYFLGMVILTLVRRRLDRTRRQDD